MENQVNMNQQQLDPSKMSVVKCKVDDCGHDLLEQKFEIRRASPITSPNGQEMFVQIPMMVCGKCDTRYPVKESL